MNIVSPNSTKSKSQIRNEIAQIFLVHFGTNSKHLKPLAEDLVKYIATGELPWLLSECYVGKDGNAHHDKCNHPNWNFKYKG